MGPLAALVVLLACAAPGASSPPAPTLLPTQTPWVYPTETPVPAPQPGLNYPRMPPRTELRFNIEQESDSPYPVLKITYRQYNACTIPGEHQAEYEPGMVRVYVHQLVTFPAEGCPARRLEGIVHRVPLDQLVNGDKVFVNDEFVFEATNLVCRDYGDYPCPVGCQHVCASPPHREGFMSPTVCINLCVPPSWRVTPQP